MQRAIIRVAISALALTSVQATMATDAAPTRYVVGVTGMICPTSCTNNVREAIKTLPEVADVSVDFETKTATITTRAAATLTREQVHKALKGSGFGVGTFELQPGS
jgi:copper chaperone CopZ